MTEEKKRLEIMRYLMEEHPLLLRDEYQAIAKQARDPSLAADAAALAELEHALQAEDAARNPVVQVLKESDNGPTYAAYWGHNKLLLTAEEARGSGDRPVAYGIVSAVADSPRFFTIPDAVQAHLHGDKQDPEYIKAANLIADSALDILRCGDDATEFLEGITKIGSFTNHEDDDDEA